MWQPIRRTRETKSPGLRHALWWLAFGGPIFLIGGCIGLGFALANGDTGGQWYWGISVLTGVLFLWLLWLTKPWRG